MEPRPQVIFTPVARLELRKQQPHLTDQILRRGIAGAVDVPGCGEEPALELGYALLARQISIELRADFLIEGLVHEGAS